MSDNAFRSAQKMLVDIQFGLLETFKDDLSTHLARAEEDL